MSETAPPTVTIGGNAYTLPELTLYALRTVGPLVDKLRLSGGASTGTVEGSQHVIELSCQLLSAWLIEDHPDLTPEFIERKMRVREMQAVGDAITAALAYSGLGPGEPAGGGQPATKPPSKRK